MSRRKRNLNLVVTALTVVGLTVGVSGMPQLAAPYLFTPEPVMAQVLRSQDMWRRVYEQLPDLPLENEYVNKASGKVEPDHTLIKRLIDYHLYVKGRPPLYRLDWKLTLADYLDGHDLMQEGVYPGYNTLRVNPMEKDKAAIARLTRSERNALIQVLVNLFNPEAAAGQSQLRRESGEAGERSPAPNTRSSPRLPRPGDAQLLAP